MQPSWNHRLSTLDGGLCTAAVGGVNAVDVLGNGANDGTSAENPLSGEEKLDRV